MELAAAERAYDALHKADPWHDGTFENWAPEQSASFPYHYRDGVELWISDTDVNPDDQFLGGDPQSQD